MFWRLCLLFILVPCVELVLLAEIGGRIGLPPTFGVILLTGVVGAWFARREGTRAWRRVHETLAAGRVPARELVDGILVFAAGLLLITPGFLTDAVGFAMLMAPVRNWTWRRLHTYFADHVKTHVVMQGPSPWSGEEARAPDTVEGHAISVEDVQDDEESNASRH